jgi:putative acetyltransferase
MSLFTVTPADPSQPAVRALFYAALDELHRRYGANADDESVHFDELQPPTGVYLVARDQTGALVGGVAVRQIGAPEHHDSEVKRLWVRPDVRRSGVAAQLMAALETWACENGVRTLWLETGEKQPEAVHFYLREGYQPVSAFPEGVDHYPEGIKFKKSL